MSPEPSTRDDALVFLKCAPVYIGMGALWSLVGIASGGGWLIATAFFVVGLAEGPVYYLAARYYERHHPNQ